ncbi:hypothetical protein NRIC_03860 [Enterococcus florum]|uniref:Uncharacterized protein n=1 Tax=Enterococcus florum TaxID=2480627 RepID=A0A4P5P3Z6_9ENTE|nr:hypothetical protein [Enterococcus florum]GCF92495.1 hypothetical protein NRIC_03860 [Enterococcus florum]
MSEEVKWFENAKEARENFRRQERSHGVEFEPIEAQVTKKENVPAKKKQSKKKADADD